MAFTRRKALGVIIAGATLPKVAVAAFDYPPAFYNRKHQFTVLEPSGRMMGATLQRPGGKPAHLRPIPGKLLVVNFWATWCASCVREMPQLAELQRTMMSALHIAAICTDTADADKIADFLRSHAVDGLDVYCDPDAHAFNWGASTRVASPFTVIGPPTTYFVLPSGDVPGYIEGGADWTSNEGRALLQYYNQAI
jgi:hypothetical protein